MIKIISQSNYNYFYLSKIDLTRKNLFSGVFMTHDEFPQLIHYYDYQLLNKLTICLPYSLKYKENLKFKILPSQFRMFFLKKGITIAIFYKFTTLDSETDFCIFNS